jgi:predicted RNase H-like nuclease (RuvC/YqgF family)
VKKKNRREKRMKFQERLTKIDKEIEELEKQLSRLFRNAQPSERIGLSQQIHAKKKERKALTKALINETRGK